MNKVKDFFKKIALFSKSLFVSVNGKEPKLLTALKKIGKFFKGLFVKVDDKKPGFVRLYENLPQNRFSQVLFVFWREFSSAL